MVESLVGSEMRNELHIWRAWINDAKPYKDQLMTCLTRHEKLRGERFINSEHQDRFLLAQAILRDVLSRYTHQAPYALRFKRSAYGKPYLMDSDFKFNLTHSNECVLIVVATEHEVGIDVEFLERLSQLDALVKRFFSKEEQQAYFAYTSAAERRLAFYRGWTRKEAYLKAIGLGLSYPLHQFTVSLAPDERHALLKVDHNDQSIQSKWTVFSFNVGCYYLASVAVKAVVEKLQTYYWSFS